MLPEEGKISPGSDTSGLNLKETELTLGLPGDARKSMEAGGRKRVLPETVVLNLGSSSFNCRERDFADEESKNDAKLPGAKAQIVGWPPVRSSRKNASKSCKLVKVAVDGAPYLRKIDLQMYNGYHQLLSALDDMFACLTIRNCLNGSIIMDSVNGMEYVPTYEDRDGDWMMVGDVPWKMFVESCKRLRLMKSTDAVDLAPRTPSKSTSSS